MKKIKLALLCGGISGERTVSLKTGKEILKALDKSKYQIFEYDLKKDLNKFWNDAYNKKFDIVFPALHGQYGEDGKVQGMLDMIKMPYVFSGTLASALAMDKYRTKQVIRNQGIPAAKDILIKKDDDYFPAEIAMKLFFPVVIKPIESGSSVGINIAKNKKEIVEGIKEAFKYGNEVILERFIVGRELTVTILGNKNPEALPVTEIIPNISKFYDFDAKYKPGGSTHICPAKIPDKIKYKAQAYAKKVYEIVGCKDLARADFIWNEKENKVYFLEINTIPGMTKTSLVPESAKANGISFSNLLDKLITGALNS